ncbi:COMM domain-containing protein 9 [Astyanax mexicanus]|uniref:COMM domain-containing protein 9 n=2 Tax=Astyanax mexicanus TaxID=7994 RepID=A0A8B9JQW5_ASTMX|nr:COMM domain-containing protein 9 [Astyanax mexicanus]KAG9280731.1 COMM domain-containing protein 9 [Astyanax mexicanus]
MAPVAEEHFSSLQLLLKAPSKDVVRQLCVDSFPSRAHESRVLIDSTAQTLSVSSTEAAQVLTAFHTLSHHVVYHNLTAAEQILSVFPDTFHPNLKNLLTKILLEQSTTWRNDALASQISLPQLVDMEWRVDMKTASDSVSRMAVPTCILHMKIQDSPCMSGSACDSSVTVELSKETLDTMLDGLGRIRDQLSAVAGK